MTPSLDLQAVPSRVRYKVLAFLGVMTFVLYLDRVCIGQAAKDMQEDLGVSNTAMGYVFAAFTLSYALFELPVGRWGDKYGARGVLTRIVVWWSLFTALTGAALWFWMLLVVRFLFGAGEAGALPNAAGVVRRWFPEASRGTAQGIVTTTMLVGGAASPVAAAALIALVGWRWSFVLFGSIGVLWALAFYYWFRDQPAAHPAVNAAELHLIADGVAHRADHSAHPPIPWREVFGNANVWLMGALMNCSAAVFYLLISWYPKYLQEARKASAMQSGWLAGLVLAGGALGCVVGGRLTDCLLSRTRSYRISRCLLGSCAFALAMAALLVSLQCDDTVLSACFMSLAFFCMQCQIPAWWAAVTHISGRHVGALFGLMNSLGAFGGIASQVFVGSLVDELAELGYTGREQWDPAFYAYAVVMLLGLCFWLLVDPRKTVDESERDERVDAGKIPAVLMAYMDGLKHHDVERIADTVADHLTFISATRTLDKPQFLALLRGLYAGFPDWHYDHDMPEVNGNVIAVKWRQGGTHTGEFALPGLAPIAATGRSVTIPEHYFYYKVEGDRIVEIRPEQVPGGAPRGILEQIGAVQPPL